MNINKVAFKYRAPDRNDYFAGLLICYLFTDADGCRTRQPDSFDRLKTSRCMGGNYRRHLYSLRYHVSYLASSIDK